MRGQWRAQPYDETQSVNGMCNMNVYVYSVWSQQLILHKVSMMSIQFVNMIVRGRMSIVVGFRNATCKKQSTCR